MKLLSPSVADDFFIRKHFKDLQIDAPDTVYDYGERGLARNEQSVSKSPTVGLQCFNSTSSSSSSYPSSAVVRCKSEFSPLCAVVGNRDRLLELNITVPLPDQGWKTPWKLPCTYDVIDGI